MYVNIFFITHEFDTRSHEVNDCSLNLSGVIWPWRISPQSLNCENSSQPPCVWNLISIARLKYLQWSYLGKNRGIMVLTVVLALKHCLYSFRGQSDSPSTSLCPHSLFPLLVIVCHLKSLFLVFAISLTSQPWCLQNTVENYLLVKWDLDCKIYILSEDIL